MESQENMNFDGAPVKAPPATRRKTTPPTPQQSPPPPSGGTPMHIWSTWPGRTQEAPSEGTTMDVEEGEHRWTARDRTVAARMEFLKLRSWSIACLGQRSQRSSIL